MAKMMTKIFVLFFTFFLASAERAITCSTYFLTEYKTVVEGPWLFVIESDSYTPTVNRTIRRNTEYRCSDDNDVEFFTTRDGYTGADQWVLEKYYFRQLFSEICEDECDSKIVMTQVEYQLWYSHTWKLLGKFTYLYKNCDKLYWTNWIETTNCSFSRHRNFMRFCEDCDGDSVEDIYCNGNSTMQEICQPTWGEWIKEGPCVVTSCNPKAGEQIKSRVCVYGDGSKAANELCSNHSAMVTEQCTNNTLQINCIANVSSPTESNSILSDPISSDNTLFDNTSLYIGIGVALTLIVLLCILLAVVLYCRQKYRTNSTPSQNNNTHELPAVTRPIANELNGLNRDQSVVPSPYDCDQIPSSHEYELEQPISQPMSKNSQHEFSRVIELKKSVIPNAYEFEQQENLNEYEYASNMPQGANRPAVSQPTFSTVQKHGKFVEESIEYSSLARTNPVAESEYSTLSSR